MKSPTRRKGLGRLAFMLMVIVPTILVGLYYLFVSSDHYRSEMRFAVRGTNTTPLDQFGLSALPGNSSQAADAYIVIEYIYSEQVLIDINEQLGIDVRKFFARDDIDPLYRINENMPFEEFLWYWQWMTDASFNSTTSITTFRVTAFSPEDASTISKAILKVAIRLINDLSTEVRSQLISTAKAEVERTEKRLTQARGTLTSFRNREQFADILLKVKAEQEKIEKMQAELLDLEGRRKILRANSPTARVLDKQINVLTAQLDVQRKALGSGNDSKTEGRNFSELLSEYSGLELEREFAEKAYTSALSSLETSQAEARKQERYFAIVVKPTIPEVSLYPLHLINTLIAFFVFFVGWLLAYLIVQNVRDHAV